MPLYCYHCEACGKNSELLRHSSEQDDPQCPHCQSTQLTRQFATFAVGQASPEPAAPCGAGSAQDCPGGVCPMMN